MNIQDWFPLGLTGLISLLEVYLLVELYASYNKFILNKRHTGIKSEKMTNNIMSRYFNIRQSIFLCKEYCQGQKYHFIMIKWSVKVFKYLITKIPFAWKQHLTELQEEIDKSTIVIWNFNTLSLIIWECTGKQQYNTYCFQVHRKHLPW